ncbi:hypothetical protein BH11PAT1_BH11PAT1_2990 [soil metagenome]
MDTFSALADPTRRMILEMLVARGELSATEISNKFQISPPAISQHLKILRITQLVHVEKRAQQRIYHINHVKLTEFEQWIKNLTKHWDKRFLRLDDLLEKEKKKI